jgi:hypothetical protein
MFAAHIARVAAEGGHILEEPVFVVTSLASLGLAIWAITLLTRKPGA